MKIDRTQFIELLQQNVSDGKIDDLTLETRLSDIGVDSLGFATLLFAIEDKLGVQIDEKYLEGLSGLSTVAEFIRTFKTLGYEIEV